MRTSQCWLSATGSLWGDRSATCVLAIERVDPACQSRRRRDLHRLERVECSVDYGVPISQRSKRRYPEGRATLAPVERDTRRVLVCEKLAGSSIPGDSSNKTA